MGYIYKITNTQNGKIYIGQTVQSVSERWQKHIICAKRGFNRYLYDAMNHYGYENFSVETVEECDNSSLDERERFWIKHYRCNEKQYGYNMTPGGGGGSTWQNDPEKRALVIKRVSEANRGKKRTAETLEKMRQARVGKYFIDIDLEALQKDICEGMSIKDICGKYGIARRSLYKRCQECFGMTPVEMRGYSLAGKVPRNFSDDSMAHLSKVRSANSFREKNTNYKEVNMDDLLAMVSDGASNREMAQRFGVSKPTLISKCKQYFGCTPSELRRSLC